LNRLISLHSGMQLN